MKSLKKHTKKWKMAVLTWTAVYPAITILLAISEEILSKIDSLPLRTLVLTLVFVPLMVFLLMPFLQRRFSKWLQA